MIMTFDTKQEADEIKGGIHPYDRTVRPQLVTKEHNLSYWNLLNEFKKITGIGGILNTSLNLHGLPLVHKPEDAFHVMENSNLKYLAIENYLIEKT
jgi:carbamoyltransferase